MPHLIPLIYWQVHYRMNLFWREVAQFHCIFHLLIFDWKMETDWISWPSIAWRQLRNFIVVQVKFDRLLTFSWYLVRIFPAELSKIRQQGFNFWDQIWKWPENDFLIWVSIKSEKQLSLPKPLFHNFWNSCQIFNGSISNSLTRYLEKNV